MSSSSTPKTIDTLLQEHRHFAPPAEFVAQAHAADPAIYEQAEAGPEAWWKSWAEQLQWDQPFTQICDWSNPPYARWFHDGKLNASV